MLQDRLQIVSDLFCHRAVFFKADVIEFCIFDNSKKLSTKVL